jgi:hypothetical protein
MGIIKQQSSPDCFSRRLMELAASNCTAEIVAPFNPQADFNLS